MNNQEIKNKINQERDYLLQKLWDAKVIISIVLIAVLVKVGYSNNSALPTPVVNTYDVSKNMENFIGETVTVISNPIQKVGLTSFTVSDERFFSGEPIVVVNASGVPFDLPTDSSNIRVQVTGDVRNLDIPKIERDYKLNLQDESYKDYINKPAIIAKSIILAPKSGQITKNFSNYYGKKVTIMGDVNNIQSPVLFTLDENYLSGAEDLLVLLVAPPTRIINKGQTVEMVGVVRPFVAVDIERDYGITWDEGVRRQLEADYRNKAVFVADTMYP
ncbi:MAG: hypothetical protein KME30_04390 [Iphinoe sp. HA4291-MV1]|jgi:hypothetical protein|nr:hypothetical protein [Iphinoe sp. HA4291-MV1]